MIKILPTVSKPTRYLGDELNAVRKDPGRPGLIRFALAFPDIYDVGMSHLGLKILYQILREIKLNKKKKWRWKINEKTTKRKYCYGWNYSF